MAIFRGVGGSGDSSDNSYLQEVTAQANAASASATSAANSLAAIQETEVTSASFNTSDGVLTLTKTGGATVTADLDGRFLTSYTETNDLSTAVTWANVPDANITQSSVTQHQAALSITESQISDLQTYLTAETNDLSTTVTWANVPDANITQSSVTQHQAALSITESQISDLGTYLTASDITGKANLSGATFTGNVAVGIPPSGTQSLTVSGSTNLYGGADLQNTNITDVDTLTAKNVNISTSGSVTTNIATGSAGSTVSTKTLNLGTGFSGFFAGLTTVNIGTQSTDSQNTINLGSGVSVSGKEDTINLKGNVTVDGTLNGGVYERTVRTRFQRRGYTNFIAITNLTSTYTQIGNTIRKDADVTVPVEHTLDLNITAQFSDINSTNDGDFIVEVYAPTPSNEATVNLGSVTIVTLGTAKVSGDVTKHFSAYCGLSVNSDGSNAFGFNNNDGWWYNESTDETFIYYYPYQANTPSTGNTLYLHPFDWETLGTAVVGDSYPLDAYNANGNVHQNQFIQIYLGYFKTDKSFIIRAKEQSTSENIGITRLSGTYTQIIGT